MGKQLEKYQKMRDFSVTPEPSGAASKKKSHQRLIFVVQKHQASHLHYDFRLELAGVLKSWAVPKGPSYDPDVKRLAMMTEDHPYDYAGFEGVIPEGNYGAGNVIIWDQGWWKPLEEDPDAALEAGKLTFELHGKKLLGEWTLIHTKGRSGKGNEWLLIKHRDEVAVAGFDVTVEAPRSVVSNRLVEDASPARTWKSNRSGSTARRKPRTVATVVKEGKKKAAAKTAKKK